MSKRLLTTLTVILFSAALLAACGDDGGDTAASGGGEATTTSSSADSDSSSGGDSSQKFPEIVDAEVTPGDDGSYEFAVTVSSPYDSPERYADAWRVLSPSGDELGVRELLHDHAGEQPFTRSEMIEVPDDVEMVTIEGSDLENGYGGKTLEVQIPS